MPHEMPLLHSGTQRNHRNNRKGAASLRSRTCVKRNAVFGAHFKGLSLYFLDQKGNLIRIKTGLVHLDTYLRRIQTRTPLSRYPPYDDSKITKIFHLMCHEMPFWCGIRCNIFLDDSGCGCVWAVLDTATQKRRESDSSPCFSRFWVNLGCFGQTFKSRFWVTSSLLYFSLGFRAFWQAGHITSLKMIFWGQDVPGISGTHTSGFLTLALGCPGHTLYSGTKKEPKPKLLSPDIFRWGGGLPREGVGAKKFGMSLEAQGIKLFWRDIRGFCRDIPEAPEKFEKIMFGFNFWPLFMQGAFSVLLDREWPGCPAIWVGTSRYQKNLMQEIWADLSLKLHFCWTKFRKETREIRNEVLEIFSEIGPGIRAEISGAFLTGRQVLPIKISPDISHQSIFKLQIESHQRTSQRTSAGTATLRKRDVYNIFLSNKLGSPTPTPQGVSGQIWRCGNHPHPHKMRKLRPKLRPRRIWAARIQKYCKSVEKRKLRQHGPSFFAGS